MNLEDFADLPRIPFNGRRLIVGPITEIAEIIPRVEGHIRVFVEGIYTYQNFSRQYSSVKEPIQRSVYVLGVVEEEKIHELRYGGELTEEIKKVIEKIQKGSIVHNLAYLEGRKPNSHEGYTINLIPLEDLIDYQTVRLEEPFASLSFNLFNRKISIAINKTGVKKR